MRESIKIKIVTYKKIFQFNYIDVNFIYCRNIRTILTVSINVNEVAHEVDMQRNGAPICYRFFVANSMQKLKVGYVLVTSFISTVTQSTRSIRLTKKS